MKYQQHIDGLRAIAVLAVLGDHLGFRLLSGGYVGVDIFFVISGYLITSIIAGDLDAGTFSFRTFYERRVRRILPALVVVVAAVLAASFAVLLPLELVDVSKSALASLLSVANIWFWTQVGYFDGAAYEKPLLHTWSLGVEEQFYLLFPFALVLLHRTVWRYRLAVLSWSTVLLALMGCVWADIDAPSAFYLLPARAWELSLGATLAVARVGSMQTSGWLGIAGLALVTMPIFGYVHDTPFPGIAAIPVCLGTAMLLIAGSDTSSWISRFLSLRPLRFVGKISYSLYLWHWPVIVLQESTGFLGLPDWGLDRWGLYATRLSEFLISFALATATYYFIEQPFRRASPPRLWHRPSAILATLSAMAGVSAVVVMAQGFGQRFPVQVTQLESYLQYDESKQFRSKECFVDSAAKFDSYSKTECLAYRPGVPNVLVLGDSHAAHLWHGLSRQAPGANVMQATAIGCRPWIGSSNRAFPACGDMNRYVYDQFLKKYELDLLVLAGRWTDEDLASLDATLAELRRRKVPVLLIGPVVEYSSPLPRLLAQEVASDGEQAAARKLVRSRFEMDKRLADIAARHQTAYFSIVSHLCRESGCEEMVGPVPIAFDYGHFTDVGSEYVGRMLVHADPLATILQPSQAAVDK